MKKSILVWTLLGLTILFAVLGLCLQDTSSIVCYGLGCAFLFAMLVVIITYIFHFNKITRLNNKVHETLALIDIHLKLRFDLVPNLVSTVKGYMKHEKEVLEEVTRLRNLAANEKDEDKKIEYANQLLPKMKQIIAISENYPELKANAVFKQLMEELVLIEDKLVASRRFYDSNVNEYNTAISTFPGFWVAGLCKFEKHTMFKIDAGENINVNISLGDNR